jgi:septal ring factor EnvC (AmiA/AmiB activator)
VRALALWLALLWPVATPAAPPAAKKAELRERQTEIKDRIEALRRDLAKSEESHSDAVDQLRETESAISHANRRLHQLTEVRAAAQAEMAELEGQARRLQRQSEAQQGHLARLLYRHYTRGEADALQLLLSGRDPNLAALDYRFLTQLSRA